MSNSANDAWLENLKELNKEALDQALTAGIISPVTHEIMLADLQQECKHPEAKPIQYRKQGSYHLGTECTTCKLRLS